MFSNRSHPKFVNRSFLAIYAIISILVISNFLFIPVLSKWDKVQFIKTKMYFHFLNKLTIPLDYNHPIKHDNINKEHTALYVLAGTQKSLSLKIPEAASIYHKMNEIKILVLTAPGITLYEPKLARNLTNDEWTIKQLTEQGVKQEDIIFINLPAGIGGTQREAKAMARFVKEKNIKRLFLVCSDYHAGRVKVTFGAYLKNTDVDIIIRPVHKNIGLRVVLQEYVKFLAYKWFLVPLST